MPSLNTLWSRENINALSDMTKKLHAARTTLDTYNSFDQSEAPIHLKNFISYVGLKTITSLIKKEIKDAAILDTVLNTISEGIAEFADGKDQAVKLIRKRIDNDTNGNNHYANILRFTSTASGDTTVELLGVIFYERDVHGYNLEVSQFNCEHAGVYLNGEKITIDTDQFGDSPLLTKLGAFSERCEDDEDCPYFPDKPTVEEYNAARLLFSDTQAIREALLSVPQR